MADDTNNTLRAIRQKIPGVRAILHAFPVMHRDWEMDSEAWVVEMEDGSRRIVSTNHCALCLADVDEFTAKLAEYRTAIAETEKALALVDEVSA